MAILEHIKNRKSVLVYQQKDIEKEKVSALIEAARWAPSFRNFQPWS